MRIPIKWLKEYVDFKGSAKELAEVLTMSGTESEILSGVVLDQKIIVGEILEINPHPNADKLQVPKVKISSQGPQPKTDGPLVQVASSQLDIVCGARNIEVGQKVPVALIGAKLGDFEINEVELRGVKSKGMICSEQELGISDHSEGIMVLNADAPVGKPLSEVLKSEGDILEAEITPNRGDCLSMIGIAKEVAAVKKSKVKMPEIKLKEAKEKTTDYVSVEVEEKDLCPRYTTRIIKIKENGESPKWMKDRLSEYGIRPISALVDITNYVMVEMGQPLHAFDFDKISGGKKKILGVRLAKSGEEIVTLDNIKRKLTKEDLVITDGKKPIAIAGVMGGKETEVDDNTKIVLLESATFDKTSVRKTAQRLTLRSESSSRFEKGMPMPLNPIALDRATQLIAEICNGEVLEGKIDVLNKWIWINHIGLRITKVEEFLGQKIETKEIIDILRRLGFEAEKYDIAKEAKSHVGKPYAFGAKYKTHGTEAFDCSYLSDYLYSRIGKYIGYTSLGQIEIGTPVNDEDLKPGDILFVKGIIDKSVTDHYFMPDGNGGYIKVATKNYPKGVGHNGVYVGDDKVIHARHYQYDRKTNKWVKESDKGEVVEESVDVFLKNPEYLGARRYVENLDDYIAVTVPWWRLDVSVEEDLMEEVARIYGYNNIKNTLPKGEAPVAAKNQSLEDSNDLKKTLKGFGFTEMINYSFIGKDVFAKLGLDLTEAVQVANPIASDMEYMRTSLIPSLLANLENNQNNFSEIKIFELAKIYLKKNKALPEEKLYLSGVLSGGESSGIRYKEGKNYYLAKGALENLLNDYGVLEFKETKKGTLQPGRSAELSIGKRNIGFLGEARPDILKKMGIKKSASIFELDLTELFENGKREKSYKSFSRFPGISRDLAFVIDKKIAASDLISEISKVDSKIIQKIEIKDIYEGKELGDKKSVTVNIYYQAMDRTLSDDEVAKLEEKSIDMVKNRLGGMLRK